MPRPTTSVVICAYTMDRWDDLRLAVSSTAQQTEQPDALLLVVDHNPELLTRVERELVPEFPLLQVIPNDRKQGLSGARNTALERVTTAVVAFLDDDAAAAPDWLERLTDPYVDPVVIGVGGAATPRWSAGDARSTTLPISTESTRGELDWVVGCTYLGQPEVREPVRNTMGCNMSFRTEVFTRVGGFSENLGRVGRTPLGCEETELCIRASEAYAASQIVFEPAALVHHHVSSDRLTWRYLTQRCYAEGLSKAAVTGMVGSGQALSTERTYASRVLPSAVRRELRATVTAAGGRRRHLLGAFAIVLGLAATTIGFVRGRLSRIEVSGAPVELLRKTHPTRATGTVSERNADVGG